MEDVAAKLRRAAGEDAPMPAPGRCAAGCPRCGEVEEEDAPPAARAAAGGEGEIRELGKLGRRRRRWTEKRRGRAWRRPWPRGRGGESRGELGGEEEG